ncbi:Thioredoxin reductase [Alteracholeplasma palmae J233]|uniref:Thioredoxin reductase n=1 Tax=Alteracholeplasma palmae (strain ATCC 49389 / J233) TaxID=1318466 RepID=U4KJU4_ALTPJ|nr:FAD-dependent oxidoreductase [Alteracholeplasma palmae]CCV63713.1 Thioredoxin reductase [Alteracholeplasma palmae J233]
MYDCLIIGAGPAGMTAGIYAKRANLKVAVFEKMAPGGQIVNTAEIENYTGYTKMSGADLALKMFNHTQEIGVETIFEEVIEVIDNGKTKTVVTSDNRYETKTILIATGTVPRMLGVTNEESFANMGISWCAICDGPLYKEKNIAVIGGGNSAVEEAYYLSTLANHVTVIQNLATLTADKKAIDILAKAKNVTYKYNSKVIEFVGSLGQLEGILIENENKEQELIKVDGVFEYIGLIPVTKMFKSLGILDEYGYVLANEKMQTNVLGVFSAGDVNKKQIRQVVTATADGAIAVQNILKYLEEWE